MWYLDLIRTILKYICSKEIAVVVVQIEETNRKDPQCPINIVIM